MLDHVVTHDVAYALLLVAISLGSRRSTRAVEPAPVTAPGGPPVGHAASLLLSDRGDSDAEPSGEHDSVKRDDDSPRLQLLKERVAVLARLIGDSRTPPPRSPGG